MPRKAFLADVTAAANKLSPNIIDVKRGDDDGDIDFIYISPACPPVSIGLIALGMYTRFSWCFCPGSIKSVAQIHLT